MTGALEIIGRRIAKYLDKPTALGEPIYPPDLEALQATLRPGDVLLIESNNRISDVIKYLTQSTWSHAALCVGALGTESRLTLVEASLAEGVVAVPLSKYTGLQTRICRPVGLSPADCEQVCRFVIERIGLEYDLKNIIDLARYLVPLPVPRRWRRRMIALGSGNPTQMICSGMIAQAFQSVRYPILPKITTITTEAAHKQLLEIRHSSLFVPRDFDISPYFAVVKPMIEKGFNYKNAGWVDLIEKRVDA